MYLISLFDGMKFTYLGPLHSKEGATVLAERMRSRAHQLGYCTSPASKTEIEEHREDPLYYQRPLLGVSVHELHDPILNLDHTLKTHYPIDERLAR